LENKKEMIAQMGLYGFAEANPGVVIRIGDLTDRSEIEVVGCAGGVCWVCPTCLTMSYMNRPCACPPDEELMEELCPRVPCLSQEELVDEQYKPRCRKNR